MPQDNDADPVLLEVTGVSKSYGATRALEPCSLQVMHGSVHGILGKNGAGKSTLVGVVAGTVKPDSGGVFLAGQDVTGLDRIERQQSGIVLLEQHPELVENLTVAENLLLPDLPKRAGLISWPTLFDAAQDLLDEFELALDPRSRCSNLSVSDQRRLLIVRAMSSGADLVLLDEPTASLTRRERAEFFRWIRRLNALGRTFVFISHFTNEIREICDTFTVLRDGRISDQGVDPQQMSIAELSRRVVGSAVDEFHRQPAEEGEVVVRLRGFAVRGVEPFDLEIRRGEVVGFAGLPGSGATEVARGLAGIEPRVSGQVEVDGKPVVGRGVSGMVRSRVVYLTSDRQGEGLVDGFSVAETVAIGRWPTGRFGFVDRSTIRSQFERLRERLSISTSSHSQMVMQLSGGNQQKILFARMLASSPTLLILDEPTHGIDVGAKVEVHRLIDEMARAGQAVILLAYDIEELVSLADRVLVFRDDRLEDEIVGEHATFESVVAALDQQPPLVTGGVPT